MVSVEWCLIFLFSKLILNDVIGFCWLILFLLDFSLVLFRLFSYACVWPWWLFTWAHLLISPYALSVGSDLLEPWFHLSFGIYCTTKNSLTAKLIKRRSYNQFKCLVHGQIGQTVCFNLILATDWCNKRTM